VEGRDLVEAALTRARPADSTTPPVSSPPAEPPPSPVAPARAEPAAPEEPSAPYASVEPAARPNEFSAAPAGSAMVEPAARPKEPSAVSAGSARVVAVGPPAAPAPAKATGAPGFADTRFGRATTADISRAARVSSAGAPGPGEANESASAQGTGHSPRVASSEAWAAALAARALLAARFGDWRLVREAHEQRLALGVRDTATLVGLALARLRLGDRGAARALASDALALATQGGERGGQARALRLLAEIATERGDFAQAATLLTDSLAAWADLRDRLLLANCLDTCAALAAARTHAARALRLASAAASLREAVGAPLRGAEHAALERWLSAARQSLGPEAADLAEAEGYALSPEQAIDEAVARAEPSVAEPESGQLDPLSNREAEVAILVARGWTNAQIGSELHLSERTVEAHLRRITHKLGFASRTQLAAWTVQRTAGRVAPRVPTSQA
jgi:DNA-binding NarL/FixJ family response regulator